MGTARACPVVVLVNFLSLPLCIAASVLKAHPEVSPVADLTDIHIIKGGLICFRLKAKVIEANFTARAFNGGVGYRMDILRCEARLFEESAQFSKRVPIFYWAQSRLGTVYVGGIPDYNCRLLWLLQLFRCLWELLPYHRSRWRSQHLRH